MSQAGASDSGNGVGAQLEAMWASKAQRAGARANSD